MLHPQDKLLYKEEVDYAKDLVVENENMYHWGRPGEHFMTHFQYYVCQFMNKKGKNPMSHRLEYNILLCII